MTISPDLQNGCITWVQYKMHIILLLLLLLLLCSKQRLWQVKSIKFHVLMRPGLHVKATNPPHAPKKYWVYGCESLLSRKAYWWIHILVFFFFCLINYSGNSCAPIVSFIKKLKSYIPHGWYHPPYLLLFDLLVKEWLAQPPEPPKTTRGMFVGLFITTWSWDLLAMNLTTSHGIDRPLYRFILRIMSLMWMTCRLPCQFND